MDFVIMHTERNYLDERIAALTNQVTLLKKSYYYLNWQFFCRISMKKESREVKEQSHAK